MAIDSVVWFLAFLVGVTAVGAVTGDLQVTETGLQTDLEGAAGVVGLIAWLTLALGYHTLAEWRYGATIGKYLVGIRVRDSGGNSLTLRASFGRNLLRLVDWLPMFYLLAIIVIALTEQNVRIGDRVAGTAVYRL